MTEPNPADVQDIVYRLRNLRPMPWDDDIAGIGTEAADEIGRLRAAQSDLVKQINGLNDAMAQAEGIIADLRADRYL